MESREVTPELILPVTVEFEDVDSYRIAHHSRLIVFLERARLRLLASHGFDLESTGGAPAPVLYELKLRFRKPARLLDQLEVAVFVRDFDDYRVTLGYRIRRGSDTLVKATSIIAFADLASGSLTTMPASLARSLKAKRKKLNGVIGEEGPEG